ncbi:hypothetical protein SAY87_027339 [Trapa incisa]|uniref:Uncharacterized protein n=1 Tax=Trapa incisa TaxID=236973 RepID=A0AAN7JMA7_9MYRT|nr:hypothetical protein SAY87_027339 [Trapa incisa]
MKDKPEEKNETREEILLGARGFQLVNRATTEIARTRDARDRSVCIVDLYRSPHVSKTAHPANTKHRQQNQMPKMEEYYEKQLKSKQSARFKRFEVGARTQHPRPRRNRGGRERKRGKR